MSEKLKVGVVGVGGIWRYAHQKALMNHPEVEVVAICDINKERLKQVAEENKVPNAFEDYNQLIGMKEIDAVVILTPNALHSKVAVAALNAGKHVFTEKPDAVNATEAQKMVDAYKASGKVLMAMRNNRFTPAAKFMKKYIESGKAGEVYTGRCGWLRRRGIPGKGGWFTTKELSGGGPLIDLGVHMIDLAIWLMGNPRPVAVSGATYRHFAKDDASDSMHSSFGDKVAGGKFDVEDLATGFVRFDNGATLQIEFSWASNIEKEGRFVELRGSKAGFAIRNGDQLDIFTEDEGILTNVNPQLGAGPKQQHEAAVHHFIDVVKGRAQPIIKPEDGLHMVKILSAIYQSAETKKEVQL